MDCVDLELIGADRSAIDPAVGERGVAARAGGRVLHMPTRFTVIRGGREAADTHDRPKTWLCTACKDDTGEATSLVEPVWQAPLREAGRVRLSSGTKRIVCTCCKLRGKLTFVD